ncbi:MAG: hypothetical protein ABIE84_05045 [bacterium]
MTDFAISGNEAAAIEQGCDNITEIYNEIVNLVADIAEDNKVDYASYAASGDRDEYNPATEMAVATPVYEQTTSTSDDDGNVTVSVANVTEATTETVGAGEISSSDLRAGLANGSIRQVNNVEHNILGIRIAPGDATNPGVLLAASTVMQQANLVAGQQTDNIQSMSRMKQSVSRKLGGQ